MANLSSFTAPHLHFPTKSLGKRQKAGSRASGCACQEDETSQKGHKKLFCCSHKAPVFVVPSSLRTSGKDENMRYTIKDSNCKCTDERIDPITLTPISVPSSCNKKKNYYVPPPPEPEPEPPSCGTTAQTGMDFLRHITFQEPAASNCCGCDKDDMPQISKKLSALIKTLEAQVALEVRQKEQLNSINDQLKGLSSTVASLSEKCKHLGTQGQENDCGAPCSQAQYVGRDRYASGKEDAFPLTAKTSSVCQFCKHKNLPVLDSMYEELYRLIGPRPFIEIALTILLRPDNIYHVNVRALKSNEVLGCLLVNEEGIKEANMLGIFSDITTFCVIDSRNTLSQSKGSIFGGHKFEFIRDKRLSGGHTGHDSFTFSYDEPTSSTSMIKSLSPPPKELTQVFCLTELLKAKPSLKPPKLTLIRDKSFKQFKELADALYKIENIDSNLLLSDDEANYPVRSIALINLMDSSNEDLHSFYPSS